jgi:hypothetical protein
MQILPSNLLLFLLASAYISYTSARTETKKEISPTNSSTTIDNDQTVPKPKKNMPIPGGPIPKDPNSDEIKVLFMLNMFMFISLNFLGNR